MKENYNHENRHKYYLKCHLIFCIKYRRKILKGEFDDNNKISSINAWHGLDWRCKEGLGGARHFYKLKTEE